MYNPNFYQKLLILYILKATTCKEMAWLVKSAIFLQNWYHGCREYHFDVLEGGGGPYLRRCGRSRKVRLDLFFKEIPELTPQNNHT